MKYSEKLVETLVKLIQNSPMSSWWGVAVKEQHDDIQYAVIRMETLEGNECTFSIGHDYIIAAADTNHKGVWCGQLNLPKANRDYTVMWIAMKLLNMYEKCNYINREKEEGENNV